MKRKEDIILAMRNLKFRDSYKINKVKETKKAHTFNSMKDTVSNYKGFSYLVASAPVWISKYQMLLKAI